MKHIIDDADKNKYEAYTKQEVLNVIQEAISSGELPDEINGLVITLKNPIDNHGYKIAFCTQAKYNELESSGQLEGNCYYFITDDSSYEDLTNAIEDLKSQVEDDEDVIDDIQGSIDSINEIIKSYENPLVECTTLYEAKTVTTDFTVPKLKGYGLYIKFDYYGGPAAWNVMTLSVNNIGILALCVNGQQITVNDTPIFSSGDTVRVVYAYSEAVHGYCWNITANITQGVRF